MAAFTFALASEIDRARYPDVLVNELLPGVVRTRMSDQGEDPKDVYRHARFVASLPIGGPHGERFNRSALDAQAPRLRTRLKQFAPKLIAGLVGRS